MRYLRTFRAERFEKALRQLRGGDVRTVSALVAILVLAAGLRLLPTRAGLPYLHDWDEPQIASTALHMMKTGDLNPHFFHYGSFTLYAQLGVDVLHYVYLLRDEPIPFPVVPGLFEHEEIDLGAIETWFETGFLWEVSHPSFYLWNRGFNALLGTATVLVTFLLGRALAGSSVGLLAAAFLALQGFHIERSAIVNPDVSMTLFALLAVYGSVAFVAGGRRRTLLAALACCGLAASAKYNGIYCGLAPLAALVLARREHAAPGWLWGALPVVPAAAFLAVTPYAVLDLPAFLSQAGFEVYHYMARGHGAVPVEAGWPHLVLQLERVADQFGVVPSLLALAGAAVLIRRKQGVTALVYPLVYFLYMATTRAAFQRNLLVIYPLLAIASAVFLVHLLHRTAALRPRPRQAVRLALTVLVTLHVGYLAFLASRSGWRTWTHEETRSRAVDTIAALAHELATDDFRVGLAEELRIHRVDLARLAVLYDVKPHLELVCDAARYDVVVTGARYVGLWSAKPEAKRQARRLNSAQLIGLEVREVGGPLDAYNVTRLDALSKDPVLRFYLTRKTDGRRPEICAASTAESM